MVSKTVASVPKAAVARIARSNGAERVGATAIVALTNTAVDYIAAVTQKAVTLANHAGRKTIIEDDILLARDSI